MAENNAINNDIGVATGTSLNLGSTTTITGMIDDDTFATASANLAASSESILNLINNKNQIIQYTIGTSTTDDATTSMSLVNSSLSVSITPTSASNRILIICGAHWRYTSGASIQNYRILLELQRSSGTPAAIVGNGGNGVLFNSSVANAETSGYFTMIGSEIAPDTNAHTYVLRFARLSTTGGQAQLDGAAAGPFTMLALELKV